MKRNSLSFLLFCFSLVLPNMVLGNDTPIFPPTLPFSYNGTIYTNVVAQSGNMSSCGGFLNIKDIWYYNKGTNFNIYGIMNPVNGTPSPAVTTIGVDHASKAVRFLSRTQNSTDNFVATEYANGASFSIGWQCYRVRMDPNSVYTNNDVYRYNSTTLFKGANVDSPVSLDISISPLEGGNVTGEDISCNKNTSGICSYLTTKNSQISLTANHSCDWAFDHWSWNDGANISTNNPETFTMSGDLEVEAVFKKTFTCTNGTFQQTSGTGGWCTDYVNSETDINFSGNASEWWQEAINGGYATGSEPAVSAIIVLDDSSLEYGHVGIVTGFDATTVTIQDSNWSDLYDFQIRNHTLSRNRSDISGYIYCTPPNN